MTYQLPVNNDIITNKNKAELNSIWTSSASDGKRILLLLKKNGRQY